MNTNNTKKYPVITAYENHSKFVSNPTGIEYAILPFTADPSGPLINNMEDANLFKKVPQDVRTQLLPFGKYTVPVTLDPRPAVKIGYELRN